MQSWVFDDQGRLWNEHSEQLMLKLHAARSGPDLTRFVVAQMGFIAVRAFQSHREVVFDPATVAPKALTALYIASRRQPFVRTSCVHASDPGLTTVFLNPTRFDAHILLMIEARTPRPDYASSPANLARSSFNRQWRMARAIVAEAPSLDASLPALDALFGGFYALAELAADGNYEIMSLGHVHLDYDPELARNPKGRSFRDAADRSFGAWTDACFKNGRACEHPTVEACNALIRFPLRDAKRYYYERLSLPLMAAGRKYLLVGVKPT